MSLKTTSVLFSPIFHKLLLLMAVVLLSSCSVYEIQKTTPFKNSAQWVMLPLINHSDTPEAGERALDIATTLLRSKKRMSGLSTYIAAESDDQNLPELDQKKTLLQAKKWAVEKKYQFAVSGSVQEWRYKSGLDAEPAVGITLTVTDLTTGAVVWSASGSKTGWGRESVSGVAHKLMATLIDGLVFSE
ncbi:MAG: hypothetical protein KAG26_02325 [Methylococcales bacterium]|nr:hypothetical protein [Methylococcales bacterium]